MSWKDCQPYHMQILARRTRFVLAQNDLHLAGRPAQPPKSPSPPGNRNIRHLGQLKTTAESVQAGYVEDDPGSGKSAAAALHMSDFDSHTQIRPALIISEVLHERSNWI